MTHEQYVDKIRHMVADRMAKGDGQATQIRGLKILYGVGQSSTRGICYYNAWKNGSSGPESLIEVCAAGESDPIQVAGTTIHEIAHAVCGHGHGHDTAWRTMCETLGLNNAIAAGMIYTEEVFNPAIWADIVTMAKELNDGAPAMGSHGSGFMGLPVGKRKAGFCPMGQGVRGGKSRGTGSGSRLVLWLCECENPPKVRAAKGCNLRATCDRCHKALEARS